MKPISARAIELGRVSPQRLHAAYQAVAETADEDAGPVLLAASADRAHLSLGASQYAGAELDLAACRARGVPVLQRVLGGGTVLVDPAQYCFFLIFPGRHNPRRHPRVFEQGLAVAARVYARFGLTAERVGSTDLWVAGRKILGSGAASAGGAMLFGASFLRRFDAALFAALVQAPSEGFRSWLAEALDAAMTDWQAHGEPPSEAELAAALREAVAEVTGWRLVDDGLTAAEEAAIAAVLADSEADAGPGERRLIPGGIKLNHRSYLVEAGSGHDWLRVLVRDRRIARIAAAEPAHSALLQAAVGAEPEDERLARALGDSGAQRAQHWAARIDAACHGIRRVWNG